MNNSEQHIWGVTFKNIYDCNSIMLSTSLSIDIEKELLQAYLSIDSNIVFEGPKARLIAAKNFLFKGYHEIDASWHPIDGTPHFPLRQVINALYEAQNVLEGVANEVNYTHWWDREEDKKLIPCSNRVCYYGDFWVKVICECTSEHHDLVFHFEMPEAVIQVYFRLVNSVWFHNNNFFNTFVNKTKLAARALMGLPIKFEYGLIIGSKKQIIDLTNTLEYGLEKING